MKRAVWAAIAAIACAACNETFEAMPASTTAGGGGSGAGGAGATDLPCDADTFFAEHCRGCHSEPPKYGAPMPLGSHADLHAPAVSEPTRTVAELVGERTNDPDRPMPPDGLLPADVRAPLEAWLAAGAPASSEGCDPIDPVDPMVGPEHLPCTVTHTFTAHAEGSAQGFHVPPGGADNLYQCFTFHSPFDGVTQGTAWAPIIDDERVVHHWILYRTKTVQPEGGVMPCQMPQDATFVAGWAPGGENFVFPEDVGLEMGGPDDYFILQMHYHNAAGHEDAVDASGVAFCTTDVPRENDAGVYTLGTLHIDIPPYTEGWQTMGQCGSFLTSFLPQPVHIISSFPHMHELGTEFRTEILRGGDDGPVETLVSIDDWAFDSQKHYPHDPPVTFDPGDAIRTTCVYDNPTSQAVHFGEKTEDEMCFNFVLLYPISLFGDNRQCGLL
jgi:hypothetical protein